MVIIQDPTEDKVTKLLEDVKYLHGSNPSGLKMTLSFLFVSFGNHQLRDQLTVAELRVDERYLSISYPFLVHSG